MKIAYACLAGTDHKKTGTECQDVAGSFASGKKRLFVLADGAGSKPFARESAELAIRTAKEYFMDPELSGVCDFSKEGFAQSINHAFRKEGYTEKNAGTTLLFFFTDGKEILTGHLGDGLILFGDRAGIGAHSLPENGEFANQTFFFPSEKAADHLRIQKMAAERSKIYIFMSDGIADLLYNVQMCRVSPAAEKLAGWAESFKEKELEEILKDNLSSVFSEKVSDDLSIGIVYTE